LSRSDKDDEEEALEASVGTSGAGVVQTDDNEKGKDRDVTHL
jgi:hypothetical protein